MMQSTFANLLVSDSYSSISASEDYEIRLISHENIFRREVEKFVSQSFEKHFSAKLSSYFPYILTVTSKFDKEIIGAVGMRMASGGKLFSECYLSQSIEQTIMAREIEPVSRNQVLELGNFAVRKNTDIKTVITYAAKYIKEMKVKWAVYTLTRPIRIYFKLLGIELKFIKQAEISAVNGAAKDWGHYYRFKPAVFYSSVTENMNTGDTE